MKEKNKIEMPRLLTQEGKEEFKKNQQITKDMIIAILLISAFVTLILTIL